MRLAFGRRIPRVSLSFYFKTTFHLLMPIFVKRKPRPVESTEKTSKFTGHPGVGSEEPVVNVSF